MTDELLHHLADYAFMRHAFAAAAILSISGAPLGVFMNLRRMSLMGDAMGHALLPGFALAYAFFGFALVPMTLAGLLTGTLIAVAASYLTRVTRLRDDAGFTLFYLLSLAAGVTIVSAKGHGLDLQQMLFGDILAVDNATLKLITGIACLTLLVLAAIYRGLVIECFDPAFMAASRRSGSGVGVPVTIIFYVLLVLNLIAAFQAMGTLMAVGVMVLPATASRFWTRNIDMTIAASVLIAAVSSVLGLLISAVWSIPSGAAVILVAGGLALISALLGRYGSLRQPLPDFSAS